MKSINIAWRKSDEGYHGILYAHALGYYLLLEPQRTSGGPRIPVYTVTYTTAGNPTDAWQIEPTGEFPFEMPSPTEEAAKQAASVWLARKVNEALALRVEDEKLSESSDSLNMHHENRDTPPAAAEDMDLQDLLGTLVDSDVGRDTLWKLSRGQGTETEDGKAWLAAAAAVGRLRGSMDKGQVVPAPDNRTN